VYVVSGSLDTSIRVWEVETGACKHTLMGHQSLTSGMELRNNILVSGNADSTVKVWDIVTGQCLQTLSGNYRRRRKMKVESWMGSHAHSRVQIRANRSTSRLSSGTRRVFDNLTLRTIQTSVSRNLPPIQQSFCDNLLG
jgi:WD40 repeat protein